MIKEFNQSNEFQLRFLDGWKKKNKIRAFTMSNLELKTDVYKKLYYSIPREKMNDIRTL